MLGFLAVGVGIFALFWEAILWCFWITGRVLLALVWLLRAIYLFARGFAHGPTGRHVA